MSARAIYKFSILPLEWEYILLPGTQLRLVNKFPDFDDKNLLKVILQEIPVKRQGNYSSEKYLFLCIEKQMVS